MATITYSICLRLLHRESSNDTKQEAKRGYQDQKGAEVSRKEVEKQQRHTKRKGWKNYARSWEQTCGTSILLKGRIKKKKNKKKKSTIHSQFISDLQGGKKSGRLECPKVELHKHLRDTHSNSGRGNTLGRCPQLFWVRPNHWKSLTWKNPPGQKWKPPERQDQSLLQDLVD